ncbi:MAG: hypothetical protein PHW02_07980, partial [bacterium]|nr:hypothetical protein [bacterium]
MQNIRTGESFYTEMNYEKILWLINLRFILIAILSLLFSVLHILDSPLDLSAPSKFIFGWMALCFILNGLLFLDINYLKHKKHILIDESNFKYISLIHIDFDIIFTVMTIMLTGGLESPLVILLIYNIITTSFIVHDNYVYFYTGIILTLLVLSSFRFSLTPELPYLVINFESHLYKALFTVFIFSFLTYLSKYIASKLTQKQEELNNLYERTYQLSITDRLTGLYDQNYFRMAASDAI